MTDLPKQRESFFQRGLIYFAIVLVVAIIIGVFVTLRLNNTTPTQSADYIEGLPKDEVRVGVVAEMKRYPLMNFEQESVQVSANIFEGLTILRNGRVVPGLAESWTNPDPLTWKITLRSGVKFHFGDYLTASDVKYTIEEAKKNESWVANPMASRVESVSVVNDTMVELKTKEPDPTLLHWLVYLGILSQEQVKKDGIKNAVGTGPYKIDSFEKNKVALTANDNYWAGQPKVRGLTYTKYKDDEALKQALEAGEADVAPIKKATYTEGLKEKGFQVVTSRLTDVNFLYYDVASEETKYVQGGKNPFKNVKVRKAILVALDIPSVIKNGEGAGEVLTQFAVPELIGYNTDLPKPKQNLQEAKGLLAEAGYKDGFTVTLDVPIPQEATADEIKKQLADVGIKVKVNAMESEDDYFDKLFSSDFSFLLLSYTADTLDSTDLLNVFFHTPSESKGSLNLTNFSDRAIDKLLDEATITFNAKDRAEIVNKAHEKIMEQLPILPLYTRLGYFAFRDDVAFKPAPFGFIFGIEISGRQKAPSTAQ